MIRVDHVRVSYRQGRDTVCPLQDVSLLARPGEPVSLTGPSGSGKSTLLRVIAGVQQPEEGTVVLDGEPVEGSGGGDPRVSLIHQDYRLVEFLTVLDNLRLAAELRGLDPKSAALHDLLEDVGLPGYGDRMPTTLSGGEQQRVAIARSIASGATVLLADEPTGALDPDNTMMVAELLQELSVRHAKVVLVATHDMDVADAMPRRLRLIDGRVLDDERRLT